MEWIVKRSSELYVSSSGLSKASDQFGYGFPFLSYKDVFNNYYAPEKLNTLVNSTEKDRQKCSVKRGDVFLTRTSETTDELGMSCVALKDYENATFNGFTKRLRPLTEEIVPEYAAYFFRSFYFRAQCQALASLITRASLNDGMIRRFKIRFPKEKKCQEKIGKILLTYDSLIENNTKRIRLLEKMAENLYKEWFVRFRFPGHEKMEIVNGLPEGWIIKKIKDYGKIETGKTPSMQVSEYYGGKYLFIKTPDMHGGVFVCSTEETLSELGNKSQPKKLLPPNSIMVSCIGTAGIVALNAKEGHTNQQINSIIPSDMVNLQWLYFTCKELRATIELFGATGATMTNLSKGKFEKLKVLEPTIALRSAFHNRVSSMFKLILKLENENSLLARQRDLLLPRLMSGKLKV